jgi:hypothetical protein
MGFRKKRTFRLCRGQLERLKPCKKISKIGFRWMKETLYFSFWQSKKLLQWYVLSIFVSTTYIITFSIYLFSKFFFLCVQDYFCFINQGYRLIRMTSPTKLIRISKGFESGTDTIRTLTLRWQVWCVTIEFYFNTTFQQKTMKWRFQVENAIM